MAHRSNELEGLWRCDYCGQGFPDGHKAREHENKRHWGNWCPGCSKIFGPGPYGPTVRSMRAHIKKCPAARKLIGG